jgi:hypothetical protein
MAQNIKASKKGEKKGLFKKKMQVVLEEFKDKDLNIGKSKKKVKNRKQAIAIALNEAKDAVKRGSIKKSKLTKKKGK